MRKPRISSNGEKVVTVTLSFIICGDDIIRSIAFELDQLLSIDSDDFDQQIRDEINRYIAIGKRQVWNRLKYKLNFSGIFFDKYNSYPHEINEAATVIAHKLFPEFF